MYYLYCIILIITGLGVAFFGLKKFSISLAVSIAIPSTTILLMLMDTFPSLNEYFVKILIGILVITVLIFVFAKITTYFFSWLFIMLLFISAFKLLGIESGSLPGFISLIGSIAIIYFIRNYLKAVIIGISSGNSIGFGIVGLIFTSMIHEGEFYNSITILLILYVFIAGGILYQFIYKFDKSDIEKLKLT